MSEIISEVMIFPLQGMSFMHIHNRNELRVTKAMENAELAGQQFCACQICVEDVYALTLNRIPPHYVQQGAIVLHAPVPSDEEIGRFVAESMLVVRGRPNHA